MLSYFVPAEDFERPLGWYGDPLPPNLVARYLEAYTHPGDSVADPFAQSAALVEEGLSRGRQAWCAHFHPLHVLAARAMLEPPSAEMIDSLLTRLGDSPKLGAPLRQHIQDLYASRCPNCGSALFATAFIWPEGSLAQKDYRCPECGAQGPSPAEELDQEAVRRIERRGTHYWYLLERTAPPGDEERRLVMSLLDLYPPRSLYALVTLFIKLEPLFPDSRELETARLLFLLGLERCTLFGQSLPERPVAGRLRRAPLRLLNEQNVWLCLEEAAAQLKGWASRYRPRGDQIDPARRVRQASLRELASQMPREGQALILTAPLPFDFGYWALGYLWTAWLFGLEAAEPLRPMVKAHAPDGAWYRRTFTPAFRLLAAYLRPEGVVAMVMQRGDGLQIAQLLAAGAQAELHLEELLFQAKPIPQGPRARVACRLAWRKAPTTATGASPAVVAEMVDSSERSARLRADRQAAAEGSIAEAFAAREEALDSSTILLAVLRRWGRAGLFPGPEASYSELENEVRERLSAGRWFLLPQEEGKIEYWWWADDRDPQQLLVDRIQVEVEKLVAAAPNSSDAEMRESIYRRFPGLATPPEGLIEACLAARSEREGPPEAGWRPRPAAPFDRGEAARLLVDLAQRGGLEAWSRFQDHQPQPVPLAAYIDVAWLEDEAPLYLFVLRDTARVGDLYRWSREGGARARHLVLVPDEHSEFLQVALEASPLLRHRFREGNWEFIKLGHVRALAERPEVDRHEIKKIIGLAPLIESPEAQLPLFP